MYQQRISLKPVICMLEGLQKRKWGKVQDLGGDKTGLW
jgi:hypothetical protein